MYKSISVEVDVWVPEDIQELPLLAASCAMETAPMSGKFW